MSNTYSIVTVIFLALACVSSLAYVCYSGIALVDKSCAQDKCTILNTFPGECRKVLGKSKGLIATYLGVASAILSAIGMGLLFGGMIVRPSYAQGDLPVTLSSIFVLLFSLVAAITLGLSSVLTLDRIKPTLISWILACAFTAGAGIFAMAIEGKYELVNLNPIVTYVTAGLGILLLALFLNPKLKSWANMEKTEVNGVTYWLRPKVNWMSLIIWSAFVVNGLNSMLFAIGILTATPLN